MSKQTEEVLERESLMSILVEGQGAPRNLEVGKYHNSDLLNEKACKMVLHYTGEEPDPGIEDGLAARGNFLEEGIAARLRKKYGDRLYWNPCIEVPKGPACIVVHPDFFRPIYRDETRNEVEIVEVTSQLDADDDPKRMKKVEQSHSASWAAKQENIRLYEEVRDDEGDLVDVVPLEMRPLRHIATFLIGMYDITEDVFDPDQEEENRIGEFLTHKMMLQHEAITARLEIREYGEALGPEPSDEEKARLAELQERVDKTWRACEDWDMRYPGRSRTEPVEPVPDLDEGVKEFAAVNARKNALEAQAKEMKKSLELTMYRVEKEEYPSPWGKCRLMSKKNTPKTDWELLAKDLGCSVQEAKDKYERVSYSDLFFRHWPNKKCKEAIAQAELEASA